MTAKTISIKEIQRPNAADTCQEGGNEIGNIVGNSVYCS